MKPWPPELGARTVIYHAARARLLRSQARSALLMGMLERVWRYAVAPCAFGRRRCSSSRGNISTKLHGR